MSAGFESLKDIIARVDVEALLKSPCPCADCRAERAKTPFTRPPHNSE